MLFLDPILEQKFKLVSNNPISEKISHQIKKLFSSILKKALSIPFYNKPLKHT